MTREYDALIRLDGEDKIPLKRAATLFASPPSNRTLSYYVTRGLVCCVTGERIYLEAFRGPGMSLITSRQAVQRFIVRMNGGEE